MLRKLMTIALILLITPINGRADCSYSLKACNQYVDVLQKERTLLQDKIAILSKQVKVADESAVPPSHPIETVGIVAAGGIGIGAAAVAVGAPLVALGAGLGALIIALVGSK